MERELTVVNHFGIIHDAVVMLLAIELGATVKKVVILAPRGDTYMGCLYFERGNESFQLDCRPSDGIALALRSKAPIVVDDEILASILQNPAVLEMMDQLSDFVAAAGEKEGAS